MLDIAATGNRVYAEWIVDMRAKVQRARETMTDAKFADFLVNGFRDEDRPYGYKWIPKLVRDEILKEPDGMWGIGIPEIMMRKRDVWATWESTWVDLSKGGDEMTDAERERGYDNEIMRTMLTRKPEKGGSRGGSANSYFVGGPVADTETLVSGLHAVAGYSKDQSEKIRRESAKNESLSKSLNDTRQLLEGTLISLRALSAANVIPYKNMDDPWGSIMRMSELVAMVKKELGVKDVRWDNPSHQLAAVRVVAKLIVDYIEGSR